MATGTGASRRPAKHAAPGALDFVCLLSTSGDRFPDTGFISDSTNSFDETRCLNNPKGILEIDGIKALGFDLIYKKDGIEKDMSEGIKLFNEKRLSASNAADYGLEVKNFGQFKGLIMSRDAAFRIFGVNSYASRQFWKKEGPICNAAMSVELSRLKEATCVAELKSVRCRERWEALLHEVRAVWVGMRRMFPPSMCRRKTRLSMAAACSEKSLVLHLSWAWSLPSM